MFYQEVTVIKHLPKEIYDRCLQKLKTINWKLKTNIKFSYWKQS